MSEEPVEKFHYKTHFSMPFVQLPGIIAYVLDFVTVIIALLILIGVINSAPWLLIGWLMAMILVMFILWLLNIFYFAPRFETQRDWNCKDATFKHKLSRDLGNHNDQTHTQFLVVWLIFLVIFLGIFYGGHGGVQTFQPLPPVPTGAQIESFVIMKCFVLAVIGTFGMAFFLLCETHSDFLYRHLIAMNRWLKTKNVIDENENIPIHSRIGNTLPIYH